MSDQKKNQGQPKSKPQEHVEIASQRKETFENRNTSKGVVNRVNPTLISKPKGK